MADLTINCTNVEPFLDAYHDGELRSEQRASVEKHISSCEACSKKLADIQLVVTALKSLPRRSAPRDFSENIDAIINAKPSDAIPFHKRRAVWASASVAAAVALLVFGLRLVPGTTGASVISKQDSPAWKNVTASNNRDNGAQESADAPVSVVARKESGVGGEGDKKLIAAGNAGTAGQSTSDKHARPTIDKQAIASRLPEDTGSDRGAAATVRDSAHEAVARQQGSVVRSDRSMPVASLSESTSASDLVAVSLYDESTSVTDELGITTDEDGLYALKL